MKSIRLLLVFLSINCYGQKSKLASIFEDQHRPPRIKLNWTYKVDSATGDYLYYVEDSIFVFRIDSLEFRKHKDGYINEHYSQAQTQVRARHFEDSISHTLTYKRNQELRKSIAANRSGVGSGAFKISVDFLEKIVNIYNVMQFERCIGKWESLGADNQITYHYNETTHDHDIPFYLLKYSSSINNLYHFFEVETNVNRTQILNIRIHVQLPGIKLAELKKSLDKRGYLINERLSQTFGKQTWVNEQKKIMILISGDVIKVVKTR